ncbi:SDR family NAD(P)-dependent oxidoreductase [Pseudomonas sp. NMI760_13]|jgi:NADP-dependent 3-hydroxy acid dehydrogenase YdfG|uniref:SDR family NAD(P)-dependent oxidoreductase n=1 Tax=Pseudomonas sp. NMI760_13 TaxID=2903147 RepID=UPI001E2A61FD|nr:SDR family oxidoreductase [Pseudomonas sp. NMI760_13]MCE0912946.1 SDR family oxidoreductase [Pseudomonas sp. NMI760_13]MDC0686347.1 SDR family NAD(P)-dependent oxidoreductase [Mitsuaria sp. RG]
MTRRFWITGASHGLGLALVEQLLAQGHTVAASGRDSQELDTLGERHGTRLLRLFGPLQDAGQRLKATWGALDCLLVNAGSCDYLPDNMAHADLFEQIVSSNLQATHQCLNAALPLLAKGQRPQVMAILSRYSALQLFEPNQPLNGGNSLPTWLSEQRNTLSTLGIDLTVVAPQSLKTPVTSVQAIPEPWTAQSAAQELLAGLDERQPELVLEVLNPGELWPLPKSS